MNNQWEIWQNIFAWNYHAKSGLYVNTTMFGLNQEMLLTNVSSSNGLVDVLIDPMNDNSNMSSTSLPVVYLRDLYHEDRVDYYMYVYAPLAAFCHDCMSRDHPVDNSREEMVMHQWHKCCTNELERIIEKFSDGIPTGVPHSSVFSDGFYTCLYDYLSFTAPNNAGKLAEYLYYKEQVQDVYFFQGCDTQRIKIGISKDVQRRLKSIQAPEPLKLMGIIKSGGKRLEKELHQRFESLRVHNEWFKPDTELLEYIRTHAIT